MWLILAFVSAALLGFYDIAKKKSLNGNAVLPVLFVNTLLSSAIFLPFIILSHQNNSVLDGTMFYVYSATATEHLLIILKSVIVLSSWICGYFAMKHLPLTIVGPINATRPVMVLIGAMLVFNEQLNGWQWAGTLLAVFSFFLLSVSGKKEGINFRNNIWVLLLVLAAVLGAVSGLYDKFLMKNINHMTVQAWFNIYQLPVMGAVLLLLWIPKMKSTTRFQWRYSILFIPLFLAFADFVYFYALSLDGAMISIVSMVRRSSVIVSFMGGALLFHEKNLKGKAIDLVLILIGMICLFIGSYK